MISFLIKECYIKAFGHVFQQVKGIIMGGKISGWLSDCSLMVDEFLYIKNKISNGSRDQAISLKYFRRYRDDCTTLNCDNFIGVANEIYPPSLSLTQENDNPYQANVLDMVVDISESICTTKVFCKTDNFPFNVITLPFLESNIDNGLCYRVFYSQIIRFQRLSSKMKDFELRTKYLGSILINRGYQINLLEREFCRAITKFTREFQKWALPIDLNVWFRNIFNEQTTDLTRRAPISMSFTQPLVVSNDHRDAIMPVSQP